MQLKKQTLTNKEFELYSKLDLIEPDFSYYQQFHKEEKVPSFISNQSKSVQSKPQGTQIIL
jgi:hypothetical protein